MARWRLTQPHYLNVPGTEYEYKETSQATGRQVKKVFEVPLLLNPNEPNDCNYPGEVIVCHEGKGQSKDYTFLGEPTPDMEPLDDEAKAISAALAPKWQHPIDTLPANGDFGAALIKIMEGQMKPVPNASIDAKAFAALQEQVAQLAAANSELQAKLAERPARRV